MAIQYVAAALLCHYAGSEVSADNVSKILSAVGAKVEDADALKTLVEKVNAESVDAILAKGMSQLASVPAAGAAAPAAAAGAAPAAEKKEEKKEEEPEEDDDMGFGLFD